jgi:prevent-host-death family protein
MAARLGFFSRCESIQMTNMVTLAIISVMRKVNISDLKARLSAHIQLVKDGEEVLVCDRNKPVARIVPCRLTHHSQEQRLVARGVLAPPLKKRSALSWPAPPGNISDEVMEQVLQEEREGR